jgi:hypothetical protein
LEFLPVFIASIVAIYTFRLGSYKDGLLVAFTTYIFNEGIVNTVGLADLYLKGQLYSITIDKTILFSPLIDSITVLIAGYLGAVLTRTAKPMQEAPSTTAETKPIPPV